MVDNTLDFMDDDWCEDICYVFSLEQDFFTTSELMYPEVFGDF